MGMWLSEALTVPPFSRVVQVAGKNSNDRIVVKACVQDEPGVDRWMYGGEILFTCGYSIRDTGQAVELIQKLYDKNVAALVVRPSEFMESVPKEMIDRANEIGFPIFTMPEQINYMDCIQPLILKLADVSQITVDRTEQVHNHLLRELAENRGIDGISTVLHHMIGYSVYIFSQFRELIACELATRDEDGQSDQVQKLFKKYLRYGKQESLIANKCNPVTLDDSRQRICIPVQAQGESMAFILIDCPFSSIQVTDILAIENASTMVAIDIINSRSLQAKERNMISHLLEDILLEKYTDIDIINERLNYIGFIRDGRYVVAEIGADDFESFIKIMMPRKSEDYIQTIKSQIWDYINDFFKSEQKQVLCMENSVETTLLFSLTEKKNLAYYRRMTEKLLDSLSRRYPKLHFSAGFGKEKADISRATQSWQEASLAKKAGKVLANTSKAPITMYSGLGCLRFLNETAGSEEMKAFYNECMSGLIAFDKQKNMDLVHTLDVYLSHDKSISKTADSLFLHKNTVSYRLKKIEEIIGGSLNDSQTSFDLQLCLQIQKIYGAI